MFLDFDVFNLISCGDTKSSMERCMYPNHHGGVSRVNREEDFGNNKYRTINISFKKFPSPTVIKEGWGGDTGKPRSLYIQKKK